MDPLNSLSTKTGWLSSKREKQLAILLTGGFALSLIPLCVLAFYNYPAADDFYYSIQTYTAFQQSGSVWQVFGAAFRQIAETYGNWQGTYSAVFLFALQPGLFGVDWYASSTYFLLTAFLSASLFLFKVIFRNYCGFSIPRYLCFALPILWLQLQFLPSPVQGVFWWNGSIYYLFFYSLAAEFFGVLLLYAKTDSHKCKILYSVLACVLALLIGGGNYVTALLSALLLALFLFFAIGKKSRKAIVYAIVLALLLAGLTVSILAPGNDVRALSYPDSPSVFATLFRSLYFALHFVFQWSTPTLLFFTLILGSAFYRLAGALPFSFRHPFLVLVGSFGLYTAQFMPPVYGMGSYGEGRILNIIYCGYLLFVVGNICYLAGWLAKRNKKPIAYRIYWRPFHTAVFSVLAVFFLALPLTQNEWESWDGSGYTSVSALYSLCSGEAGQFAQECVNRTAALESNRSTLVFEPFSVQPHLLFYADLTDNPDYEWTNLPMARYYQKKSIVVDWSNA